MREYRAIVEISLEGGLLNQSEIADAPVQLLAKTFQRWLPVEALGLRFCGQSEDLWPSRIAAGITALVRFGTAAAMFIL